MWVAKDNGSDTNWADAKSYCKNYRGGGYTDWRMPTQDELAGLCDTSKPRTVVTELIDTTVPWASETRGSAAADFVFVGQGRRHWFPQSKDVNHRALPVRSSK